MPASARRNLRVGEDPYAYLEEQFGQSGIQPDWDPNNPTPEQSQNMLDAIYYGAFTSDGQSQIAGGDLSGLQDVANNGLAPTQGPGQYNQFEGGYIDDAGQYHLGPSQWEHDSAWANTTNYDELMEAGNPNNARTWVKQQYMAGNLSAEEAQQLENSAFEEQYGSLSYTYEVDTYGDNNTLSEVGYIQNTLTPTDYSSLSQDPANWSRGAGNTDVERITTQNIGEGLFNAIATTALTAGVGGALAGAGLSGTALGATKGAIGGATSGFINDGSLSFDDIALGALTGGLGGSLSNPDGVLGGFINTGSELADDALRGALLGGISGAVDGDILEGALYGAAGGAATNLLSQGISYLDNAQGTDEWDFVSGPEWDENDLMNQDFQMDALQPVVPGGEYREVPEWGQEIADEQDFYDKYAPPETFEGTYSEQLDQMYQNQLEGDAFDYTQSPEFVGPGADMAAGYDPGTVQGQWMDNLTQDDFIHSNLNFSDSALSGYVNDERDFWVINTPDGYYLTDADANMVKYRGGDIGTQDFFGNNTQGMSQYDSLDPLSQHVAAGGEIPGTGQNYVQVDMPPTTEPEESQIPEETERDNTEDSSDSTPTNSTDTSEMGGSSNAGSNGNPSQDTGLSNPTIETDFVLVGVNADGERVYENSVTAQRVTESELSLIVGSAASGTSQQPEQGGGQNADTAGQGGTDSGTDAGDGDSDGSDLGEEGENDGIGDDDDEGKGADDAGSGDPGIGSGSGGNGLGGGEGLLGMAGAGSDENYRWQPIAGLTKISPYQKRRHAIYNSLNDGLLKAALQESRRFS